MQPLVLRAAPQDAGLLGFGPVVLSAHAVGHHHRLGPGISAAAERAALPQAAAAGLGALWTDTRTSRRRRTSGVMRGGIRCVQR